jgi:hypothetical protein
LHRNGATGLPLAADITQRWARVRVGPQGEVESALEFAVRSNRCSRAIARKADMLWHAGVGRSIDARSTLRTLAPAYFIDCDSLLTLLLLDDEQLP